MKKKLNQVNKLINNKKIVKRMRITKDKAMDFIKLRNKLLINSF